MDRIKKITATFFGTGLSPVAPGTMGTLGAALLYCIFWLAGFSTWYIWLALLTLACIANIWIGGWAENYYQKKDPQCVVIDEVAGYFLVVLWWQTSWQVCLGAIITFRLFDITKPFPIHFFEKFPKGWGILLDDLMAGVYAMMVTAIISWIGWYTQIDVGIAPVFWSW